MKSTLRRFIFQDMTKSIYSMFLRKLREDLDTTYENLWSIILGESIPTCGCMGALVDHFRRLGWDVSPRDFLRGTAASNNHNFILMRVLRNTLTRSELDKAFFDIRQHISKNPRKEIDHGEEDN